MPIIGYMNIFNNKSVGKPSKDVVWTEITGEVYLKDFPTLLKEIGDPPKKLYYIGNLSLLSDDAIYLCIVGPRKHSEYAVRVLKYLLEGISDLPIIIVSGLALGVDGLVHKEALKLGMKCIAIPGSGLDDEVLYPPSNLGLAKEILKADGLLLSELAPRVRAAPWSFPMRNRIMAGLSYATLIIEAPKDSGTLITGNLALDYNRIIMVVPNQIFSPYSEGSNSLIKNGAYPITNPDEIRTLLGFKEKIKDTSNKYKDCTEEEMLVVNALIKIESAKPPQEDGSRDDIPIFEYLNKETSLDISKIQIAISLLEIRGLITQKLGRYYLNN